MKSVYMVWSEDCDERWERTAYATQELAKKAISDTYQDPDWEADCTEIREVSVIEE